MFISFYPCLEKIDNANRVLFSFVLVQESPGIKNQKTRLKLNTFQGFLAKRNGL